MGQTKGQRPALSESELKQARIDIGIDKETEETAVDLEWFHEMMYEVLREKRDKYGPIEDARKGDLVFGLSKQVVDLVRYKLLSPGVDNPNKGAEELFRMLTHIANYAYLIANERRNRLYEISKDENQHKDSPKEGS